MPKMTNDDKGKRAVFEAWLLAKGKTMAKGSNSIVGANLTGKVTTRRPRKKPVSMVLQWPKQCKNCKQFKGKTAYPWLHNKLCWNCAQIEGINETQKNEARVARGKAIWEKRKNNAK